MTLQLLQSEFPYMREIRVLFYQCVKCRSYSYSVRIWDFGDHSHAPSIRSHKGTQVVWPDFEPMRVSEEPVCIYLFRQNPDFTSLHLKSPLHVIPPRNNSLCSRFDPEMFSLGHFCSFCFDLAKFWTNLVHFASIVFWVGLSSFLPCLGQTLLCFDLARIETLMVCFHFNPGEEGTSFSLRSRLY